MEIKWPGFNWLHLQPLATCLADVAFHSQRQVLRGLEGLACLLVISEAAFPHIPLHLGSSGVQRRNTGCRHLFHEELLRNFTLIHAPF